VHDGQAQPAAGHRFVQARTARHHGFAAAGFNAGAIVVDDDSQHRSLPAVERAGLHAPDASRPLEGVVQHVAKNLLQVLGLAGKAELGGDRSGFDTQAALDMHPFNHAQQAVDDRRQGHVCAWQAVRRRCARARQVPVDMAACHGHLFLHQRRELDRRLRAALHRRRRLRHRGQRCLDRVGQVAGLGARARPPRHCSDAER
jgi:hypothetical protein